MRSPVVTVGLRAGALDAAERLGRPVVAVVEKAPGPKASARLAGVVVAPFDPEAEPWESVAAAVRAHEPAAVVALTERSVPPAAHLAAALGLPGLPAEAAHRCSDKRAMKRAARAAGIPCADVVEAEDGLRGDEIVERLGLPLVLKSAVGSGSRGTVVVRDAAEVPPALPPGWMAESFVDGVEMSVESFVVDGEAVWISPTQYLEPAWSSLVPAPLPASDREAALGLAEAARVALGVTRGMTHAELFLTPSGPVFGELAARPPGGHLMPLIHHAYGADPWEAVLRLACGEAPGMPAEPSRAAAVRLFHPGPGTVVAAEGADAAQAMPGVEVCSLRVGPGDAVGTREGTGQEVGHVLVTAETAAEAEARLAAAVDAIRVEVDRRGG
ncbi:ATP-grasp domain-containing protein [Rubrivirga marina]|uniref:ATP-grasp domain-containing protein n=1 Tax=Rubrivirga marina TaxID=1196024 RepID=A0A271J3Q6_9BACT|nr:ATP-grasp domain-containing protein [Rubrivirga marina]PAP77927.1 hypothetical protein BSZ37_16520 [Rubrivirga marina]